MKKIKWSVLVLFLFFICACDREQKPIVEHYGIKDYSVIDSNVLYASDSYYAKENGQMVDIYGYDGQLYFSYDQNVSHVSSDLKYIYVYKDELVNEIYDFQGNLLMQGKINAVYSESQQRYIVKDFSLLDDEHKIVYTSKDLINDKEVAYIIYNDHLFTYGLKVNKMVNLKTKNEIAYTDYITNGDYALLTINGKYHLYKLTNDQYIDEFDSIEYGEYYSNLQEFENASNMILIKQDQKKYLIGNQYNDQYEYVLDNNYVLDFSVCSIGAQLKDENGNIVISECLNDYQFEGNMIGGYVGYSGIAKAYVNGKELTSDDKMYHFVEHYLVEDNETSYVNYDFEGNVVGDYYLMDIPQGYIGHKNNQYYFLDEKLNQISKAYQSINCGFNDYCVVKNETGYYALVHDLKEITPFEYFNINLYDNYIELDDVSQKVILHLEKGNKNFKFPEIEKPYLNQQVDDLIKEYELDQNLINKNLDFFKKYAYIVENNDQLGKYKSYVYDILPVVLDNQDCLNEPYFLQRLQTLIIQKDTSISNAGEYYSGMNKILLNDESRSTIYHELIHFLDFSMNDDFYIQLWNYQGKLLTNSEYNALSSNEKEKCEYISIVNYNANILVEGGAELMSVKHFTKGVAAYMEATAFLTGIEYIIGSDEFDKMFFSNESDYRMMKLFLDSGFTFEEYKEIYNKFLNVALSLSYNFELRIEAVDVLIDLYKANVNSDWYADGAFVYILKVLGGIGYNDFSNSKYEEYLEGILFRDFIVYEEYENELLKDIEVEVNRIPIPVFIVDNELYLGCSAYWFEGEDVINGYAYFNYDFISEKMIDYHLIKE